MMLAGLFHAVGFIIALTLSGTPEISTFPDLSAYGRYAVSSLPIAASLYLVFAVFGAFVEEVTFRGYVQSRVGSQIGPGLGVIFAALLFALQHIHIFHENWIIEFFQTQFLYLFCFGLLVGYLFIKSKADIWSVFVFHAFVNLIYILLPIHFTYVLPFSAQIVTITTWAFMMLLLRLVHLEELRNEPSSSLKEIPTFLPTSDH
jgi:membrane protease YdiL (CAAX protease family)